MHSFLPIANSGRAGGEAGLARKGRGSKMLRGGAGISGEIFGERADCPHYLRPHQAVVRGGGA